MKRGYPLEKRVERLATNHHRSHRDNLRCRQYAVRHPRADRAAHGAGPDSRLATAIVSLTEARTWSASSYGEQEIAAF
jgi:hypothetical protein